MIPFKMKALSAITPVTPAAGYIGGKKNLAKRLVALIEVIPHEAYFEPFVGMGGVFLRRRMIPSVEAINDISGDVANFFRVVQEHYPYFIDMLRFRVASRNEFERLKALPPERLTDLQRAARFLYLQRLTFGGKVSGRVFGIASSQAARFNITRIEPLLADIHERLAGVWIEQLPYGEFIKRWDRDGALFFLDPPYFGNERDYGEGVFDREDFAAIAAQLAAIKGSFVMTINDRPEVRELFAGFAIAPVTTTYTLSRAVNDTKAGELIVAGGLAADALRSMFASCG
jgi:DNA adenine methylase